MRYITLSPEIKAELGMIKLKHRELSEIANEYVNLLKERIGIWNEYKAEKTADLDKEFCCFILICYFIISFLYPA